MRWMLLLIIVLLAWWYFTPDPEPVPAEESVIGAPVRALRSAEGVEDEYLEADKARQQRMEDALEAAAGDGDGG